MVHADVVRVENIEYVDGVAVSGQIAQTEGAWGDGVQFSQKGNWATYFSFTVTECDEDCNPEWSRTIKVSSPGEFSDPEGLLEVTYQVNGDNGEKVGIVNVNRGGNRTNGFKFTMTFIPDDGFDFLEMETCISATNADEDTGTCSTTTTKNADGNYVMTIDNAPNTSLGGNSPQNAESFVKLFVKSNACD